jgi:hypothetical protein
VDRVSDDAWADALGDRRPQHPPLAAATSFLHERLFSDET